MTMKDIKTGVKNAIAETVGTDIPFEVNTAGGGKGSVPRDTDIRQGMADSLLGGGLWFLGVLGLDNAERLLAGETLERGPYQIKAEDVRCHICRSWNGHRSKGKRQAELFARMVIFATAPFPQQGKLVFFSHSTAPNSCLPKYMEANRALLRNPERFASLVG
jgi:hypothetical protein